MEQIDVPELTFRLINRELLGRPYLMYDFQNNRLDFVHLFEPYQPGQVDFSIEEVNLLRDNFYSARICDVVRVPLC